ncbi:MAG: immunoglobulin domain-containing protein, partial [Bacteroidales bacterium]|nr:immunoglobulin domain-containing protein [Bacteroidales bacterium]
MKIFSIALILGFFFYGHLFAQKEAYNWYFGHKAGITFNNYDLKPLSVDTSSIISSAGCASISDSNGNLLFYTNGETVWNRKHQIMKYGTDLSGCSGISGATQSCFIVPKTNDKNQYYIFTIDYVHCYKNPWLDTCLTKGLCYSVVDMNSSSHGEVIVKNQLLHSPVAEKITVLKHKNEKDYWIIGHEWNSNNFFAYLLLHDFGIQNIPVISRIGRNYHVDINDKEHSYCHFKRMIGYLRGSIDNKKVVSANTEHYVIEKKYIQEKGVFETEAFFGNSSIEIFDFDNLTGKLSNCFTFNLKSDSVGFYGVEFSPDRTKLYASIIEENYYCSSRNKSYLLQFHVGRTNELILIDTIYTTNSTLSALQLAPNGKIYVAKHGKYLAVIDFPNKNGKECGFRDSAVVLTSGGCWNGLPGFIYDTSLFFIHIETNSPLCEGETLELKAVIPEIFTNPSFTWTGPNGFTSTEPNPVITNVTTDMSGVYKLTVNGMSDTDSAEVIIHPNPEVGISGKTKFCEGDSTILTAAPTGTEYNYLWSTGETNPEITVKESGTYTVVVENSYGCKDSAKVSVEAIPNPEADIIAAGSTEFCKGDSVVLRAKPEGSEYSYLWSTGETSPGITVKEKGIYSVIVSVSEGCKDSASIEVTVYPLPEVNIIPDGPASFCEGDSLNLDLLDYDDYTDILWSTGEKTKRIIVTQPGEYWVEATDTNGCTGSASVDITVFPLPEVNILAIGKLRFCKGDSVILYTENEYVSYEWSTGETIREIIVKQTGIYSVNV